jgi:hypothetical protein
MSETNKDLIATKEEYDAFAIEALSDSTDWFVVHDGESTKVCQKTNSNSSINTVRVTCHFEGIKPNELIDLIYDEKNEKDLEGVVAESTVLEKIDDNNTVSYCSLFIF